MRRQPKRRSSPPRGAVLISGGGTAGHLVPGIAIARELVELGWSTEQVHFVGTRRELDARLVPDAGFGLTRLAGRPLATQRSILKRLGAAADLAWGVGRGVWLIGRKRPAAVLSLGGYGALPAAAAAVVWRVPLVLTEQNATSSATNRMLSRFAKAAGVPVTGSGLRHEVVTGMVVRQEVAQATQVAAANGVAHLRTARGWPVDAVAVVIFGGSLGARKINAAVWSALTRDPLRQMLRDQRMIIHHVVGERDWPLLDEQLAHDVAGYRPVAYDDDLATALVAADLVVCRAGGSTVAELSVTGTPAVLVPYPHAPNDHQRRNAEVLVAAGSAVIVDDADLTPERLAVELANADQRPAAARSSDAQAASVFGSTRAAAAVASLLTEHSRQRR